VVKPCHSLAHRAVRKFVFVVTDKVLSLEMVGRSFTLLFLLLAITLASLICEFPFSSFDFFFVGEVSYFSKSELSRLNNRVNAIHTTPHVCNLGLALSYCFPFHQTEYLRYFCRTPSANK